MRDDPEFKYVCASFLLGWDSKSTDGSSVIVDKNGHYLVSKKVQK